MQSLLTVVEKHFSSFPFVFYSTHILKYKICLVNSPFYKSHRYYAHFKITLKQWSKLSIQFGCRSRCSTGTEGLSWRLPGTRPAPPSTQWHSSPWPLRWLLPTSHKVQQRGCTSPPEGSPGQGTANSQTSLQSPLHTISLSPSHHSPESAITYPWWCQNVRNQTEASSKQKKPSLSAQLTAATARGEGCKQKVLHGFHRSCFSSGAKHLYDMCSSSFSQAGAPETAGQSLFGKAAYFLLLVFSEFLSHKKLSDARRETQAVASCSTWLPTFTDAQDKLSSGIHKKSRQQKLHCSQWDTQNYNPLWFHRSKP